MVPGLRWVVASTTVAVLMITQVRPTPAAADAATTKKVFARYVVDSSPVGTHPDEDPIGPWRLRLRGGRLIRLTDAMFTDPLSWPILTPHGSQVAYYRKSDGALVVRDLSTGKVRAVPGRFSREGGLCKLSPGGRFLVVCGQPYQVVNTITGQTHTLPSGYYGKLSFSPDNKYVLFHRATDPNLVSRDPGITEVFSTETWTVVYRGTQVGALRMGGSIVAYVDAQFSRPTYIRFWNLATGASAGSAIKVPVGETPRALVWDQAGHLDVLTYLENKYRGGLVIRKSGYRWRRANSGMRILDAFRIQATHWRPADGGLA
ncbi:TolB family protein [Microbispora sp. NPDC049125]|uniref:TolB family protein n=1 Tax=Microbispora sp. NPDC049125 TaxID=3154929 RepID=UPI00346608AB